MELLEINTKELGAFGHFILLTGDVFLDKYGVKNRMELASKPPHDPVARKLKGDIESTKSKIEILERMVEIANLIGILPEDVQFLLAKVTEAEEKTHVDRINSGIGRDTGVDEIQEAYNIRVLPSAKGAFHRLIDPVIKELRKKRETLNKELDAKEREKERAIHSELETG